jgi:beta-lactamase class A
MARGGSRYIIAVLIGVLLIAGYVAAYTFLIAPEPAPTAEISQAQITAQPAPQPATPKGPPAPAALTAQIETLGSSFDGRVGISVRSIDDGWTASFDGQGKFPQQSVSKLWVAASVLNKADIGELKLSDTMILTPADLTIFHQPIRKRIGANGTQVTIAELLTLAMTQSDNTANDALFRRIGGKAGTENFLMNKGLNGISMSEGEKQLQMQAAGMEWDDRFSYGRIFWQVRETIPYERRANAINAYITNPADGAAPDSITMGLAQLQKGELLSARSTAYLIDIMGQSVTGPDRLKGGLPAGWTIAHKTGTGQVFKQLASAYNDVGILTSPTGRRYAVAVMIGATQRSVPQRQALMHAVVQAVSAHDTAAMSL